MLCFLFAALIVALDQFFKQWIMRTLDIGDIGPEVIPGILGLTRWENDGAMLNILSGQQWLLAGIAFAAAVVLIMILLRYNEGFWGTLGLAAVLGGTVGNLADRVLNSGKVVDMFRTLFIDFPIFNVADIFITLGFITFLIHFIALTVKGEKKDVPAGNYYDEDDDDAEYDSFPQMDSSDAAEPGNIPAAPYADASADEQYSQYDVPQTPGPEQNQYAPQAQYEPDDYSSLTDTSVAGDYSSVTDTTSDTSFTLDALEAELGSLDDYGDYNVDDLLREYGFEDDDTV
ncbi:MAG: signal peptidase II [Oscillospiraceae bacterium]|nr:signal peptidase II [Oscillospiraceae bacterium]